MVADMLEANEVQVAADLTMLWVALSGVTRGPDGGYPIREDDDPALQTALYVQGAAVRHALTEGRNVAVTTSRAGQVERWRDVAQSVAARFRVRTADPGLHVVVGRLSIEGEPGVDDEILDILPGDTDTDVLNRRRRRISRQCRKAVERWYGPLGRRGGRRR